MNLINNFREYLKASGFARNTCKNYVSDVSNFVNYLKSQNQYFSILTLPFVLQQDTLENYKNSLEQREMRSTANRRLAALRKFIAFVQQQNLVGSSNLAAVRNISSPNYQSLSQSRDTTIRSIKVHHNFWLYMVVAIVALVFGTYLITSSSTNGRLRALQKVILEMLSPKIIDPTV